MPFVQYQVLLLPYQGKEAPTVQIKHLESDKVDRVHRQNIAYKLTLLDREDIFIESGNAKKKISCDQYKFRGKLAHIKNAGKSEAHYLLIETDYLSANGQVFFSAPRAIKAIEFTVKKLSAEDDFLLEIVTKDDVSGIKIYAPMVKKVTVNNTKHDFKREGNHVILK